MTGTQRSSTPGAGPPSPFSQTPWLTLDAVVVAVEPLARQTARTNLELSSLAGVRAKAYMALPEALSRCRTPFDLVQAQFAFWQEAGRQYAETAERLAYSWKSATTSETFDRTDSHDTIGFPEAKPDAPNEASRRPGDSRRAA